MLYKKNNIILAGTIALIIYGITACTKQTIQFGNEGSGGDPNIITIDTFSVAVSTLQVDSFGTAGNDLIAGLHYDKELGSIESKAFLQVTSPGLNLHDVNNCIYDSIVFSAKLSSGYMGDTSAAFTLNLHELTQAMDEPELPTGYNTSSVDYNSTPIASKTFYIRPSRKDKISIRLPDSFGENIFRMMKANSDTITDNSQFKNFFKGICLAPAAGNNAIYYFQKPDSSVIQLYYTIAGATPQSKVANFSASSTDLHFNAFTYNRSGTGLENFKPKTKQVISSQLTNNIGYLHFNSGLFPRISLGNLLSIKELHPYVQVIKAELQIKPVQGSYGTNTFYPLPPAVELRVTDDDNYTTGTALSYSAGAQVQTQYGNLFIDDLYGESTSYTYDVTSFVNTILSEGVFSRKALLMYPLASNAAGNDQRLLITNNTGKKPITLKLYVLGL